MHEEAASFSANLTISILILLSLAMVYLLYPWIVAANDNAEPPPMSSRMQYKIMYLVSGGITAMGISSGFLPITILGFFIITIIALTQLFPAKNMVTDLQEVQEINSPATSPRLVYAGQDLKFTDAEFEKILLKHLPYFLQLDVTQRATFLKRLRKFINEKTFVIHDTSGFKEMPVLISASAIQVSFGLDKYLMPIFQTIHIYPDEFIHANNSLRIVIGNVSNNCINISWKHFLDGFKLPDGVNVGLHEMAHAYHYQNFAARYDVDEKFAIGYENFSRKSEQALLFELSHLSTLYTLYGLSNEQEFWAESVELFFEKPAELLALDSDLFSIVSGALNQTMYV